MSQLAAYLSGLDWSPLLISLKTGIVATIISFFLGIFPIYEKENDKIQLHELIFGRLGAEF